MSHISLNSVEWKLGGEGKGSDNSRRIQRLKVLTIRVIREELSPRQRQILYAYFFNQKKIPEIARELGVNKSTVSRTLARGLKNVNDRLKYYRLR